MTKYYKLLKDLPTFKKGDLFRLSDEGSLFLMNPGSPHWKSKVMAYHHSTLEHFPNILKDWFKEVEDPNGIWKPKMGDKYYYILQYGLCGRVSHAPWENNDSDKLANEIGNVFRTEEEAEKALEWLKARKVLFEDAKGFKPNWRNIDEPKYNVELVYTTPSQPGLEPWGMCYTKTTPGPYFATKEDAEASIAEHRREWLIYLLGSDSND